MRRTVKQTAAVVGACALMTMAAPTSNVGAATATTERVSIDSGSGGGRELPAMDADGSRVVFVGRGETAQGVWLRDRTLGQTFRLTTGSHFNPAISGDGNTVVYVLYGASRSIWMIDVTDPAAPSAPVQVDLVDGAGGAPSDGLSDFPALDDDGSVVAFQSTATNLTPGTPLPSSGGPTKVYVRDLATDTTDMVSVDASGVSLAGNAIKPDLSSDGRWVAFASEQVLVTPPAVLAPSGEEETTTTYQQVYVHDRNTGDVFVASVNDLGELGNAGAALTFGPTISDDGLRVAFESDATNLVAFDTNGRTDAFVHDFDAATTVRVSERTPFDQYGPLTPVVPTRLVDTRLTADPLGPGETLTLKVTGGDVPATATAVALNITAVSIDSASFITVYPTGGDLPTASTLNLLPGQRSANAATAEVGTGGSVSIYNNLGTVQLIVDLDGFYDGMASVSDDGSGFTPLPPDRLLDTRLTSTPLTAGESRVVQVAGVGGVPATATAVALNVTSVRSTAMSFFTVYPSDAELPVASNLNFNAGQVIANSVVAALGADGAIKVYNYTGTADLIVDVTGYWDPTALNGGMTAIAPVRLLDTRVTADPIGAGETISLKVVGTAVPAEQATAVVLNVTGIKPTAWTFLTLFPTGLALPTASNLNLTAGVVRPNQVILPIGENGQVNIFNFAGTTHLVVDVTGWLSGVQVPEGGLGPAITGDGTAAAFESLGTYDAADVNAVMDAFLRVMSAVTTERVSVAIAGGTEATGTRVDGNTGLVVAVKNGTDVSVGLTADLVTFNSNGDLAGDRPPGEVEGETSTEPEVYMRVG